jgi:hypothetical protein
MPLKLAAPIYERFELEETDAKYGSEGEPTFVVIRQARQGQHEARQSLFSKLERKYSTETPNEVSVVSTWSSEELKTEEVWLTLVESNITNEDGTLMFNSDQDNDGNAKLAMSKQNFLNAWGMLYPDVCNEIHKKVLEVNVAWQGPLGEEF